MNIESLFKVDKLTDAINKKEINSGFFTKKGLFTPKPLDSNKILLEEKDGYLKILEARPMGSLGQGLAKESRSLRTFKCPHFPIDTHISAADINRVREFGKETIASVSRRVNEELEEHKAAHELTKEYLLATALQGKAIDGAGNVLIDSFAEYNVSQEVFSFADMTTQNKIEKTFRDILRIHDDNLTGDRSSGAEMACGRELYDAIFDSEIVKKYYMGVSETRKRLENDNRRGFWIEGVFIYEYSDKIKQPNGSFKQFLNPAESIIYPTGTANTFKLYVCPADFNETIQSMGLEYYAKMEAGKMDRGYNFHSQSNILPICLRPKVLVKMKKQ